MAQQIEVAALYYLLNAVYVSTAEIWGGVGYGEKE